MGTRWERIGRRRGLLGLVVVLALVLAACGGDDPAVQPSPTDAPTDDPTDPPADECETPGLCDPPADILAAAQAEGRVVMFSSIAAPTMQAFARDMQELYGIEVVFSEVTGAGALERVRAEFESNNVSADVVPLGGPDVFSQWLEDGMIDTFTVEEVPNAAIYADQPDLFRDSSYFMWGGVAYGLAWNSDAVERVGIPVPDSYCDLADPQYNGQVGVSYQEGTNVIRHLWALKGMCGEDFWERMFDNGLVVYGSTSEGMAALGAGEVSTYLSAVTYIVDGAAQQGAPLEWTLPDDGFTISTRWSAIMADAPHPNAARVFVNYLLSDRGQTVAFGESYGVSVLPGDLVPGTLEIRFPDRVQYADRDTSLQVQDEIIADFGR